jgi:Eukaryotic aspartyl protease
VERAKTQSDVELQHVGDLTVSEKMTKDEVERKLHLLMPDHQPLQAQFKWTDIKGAAGWWTSLMAGVWINGIKVLKNQPVLFDVQSPFILAPALAAARFYEAIGGSMRLVRPFDNFFAVPCQNQISIAFELGGWSFPIMSGQGIGADAWRGPTGGPFSLGRLGNGTGYCLGIIAETNMGERPQWTSSGLQDIWILGEPFFRGLGVVFDLDRGKVGFRSY